ncbi:hypothetical protein ACFLU6_06445 [Acidobacteriota bacterium]
MDEERKILTHEAKPGYRLVFFIAAAVALLYLVLVFAGVFHH